MESMVPLGLPHVSPEDLADRCEDRDAPANKARSRRREDESPRNSITYAFVELADRVAARSSLYPIIYGAQCRLIMAGPIRR